MTSLSLWSSSSSHWSRLVEWFFRSSSNKDTSNSICCLCRSCSIIICRLRSSFDGVPASKHLITIIRWRAILWFSLFIAGFCCIGDSNVSWSMFSGMDTVGGCIFPSSSLTSSMEATLFAFIVLLVSTSDELSSRSSIADLSFIRSFIHVVSISSKAMRSSGESAAAVWNVSTVSELGILCGNKFKSEAIWCFLLFTSWKDVELQLKASQSFDEQPSFRNAGVVRFKSNDRLCLRRSISSSCSWVRLANNSFFSVTPSPPN